MEKRIWPEIDMSMFALIYLILGTLSMVNRGDGSLIDKVKTKYGSMNDISVSIREPSPD